MAWTPTRRAVLGASLAGTLPVAPRRAVAAGANLTVAIPIGPDHFEPVIYNSTALYRTASNLFDSLLAYDYAAGMAVRPALAARWERLDDRAIRFHLRPGVVFHDGAPLEAADVAWSLSPEHLLGPDKAGAVVSLQTLDTIASVEVEAPDRVVVRAKGPDALLESRLAAWSSQIMSRRAFERAGSWREWVRAPVGTGPYKVAEFRGDSHVKFVRHDAYWGGAAPWESVTWRIMPELGARISALLAGDVDIATDIPPDQFATIQRNAAMEIVGGPIQNVRSLHIDTTTGPLADVRVRRALSLAVDRKLIIDTLWHGRTTVPRGYQLDSFGATFIGDFPAPAHDPALARRLLAEAGYRGEPITYKLINYYPLQVQGAQAMVAMWQEVGLNVRIDMMEGFSQVEKAPIHAMFDSSNTALLPDPLGHGWRIFGPRGELPYRTKIWSSAEYAALGARLGVSTDAAERRSIARRLLEIVEQEAPVVILFQQAMFYGKRRDVAWAPDNVLITRFAARPPV